MNNIRLEIWQKDSLLANLIACVEEVSDPRRNHSKKHDLIDIVLISVLAIFAGADNWVEVVEFAHNHEDWLRSIIPLPNGIPSHDTFTRVFTILDTKELKFWLLLWLEVALLRKGEHIAFDGKVIEAWSSKNPFVVVSAWSSASKIMLEQTRVPDKANEIGGINRLLQLLNVKGKVITIDAIGTQKNIVKEIVRQGGDYVLPVKGNHPRLHDDVRLFLNTMARGGHEEIPYDYYETVDCDHGRKEIRRCYSTNYIDWMHQKKEWANFKSLTVVELITEGKGRFSTHRRYFISSLPANAQRILGYVRDHWSIENNLHWTLDVHFNDDANTLRKGNGPQNLGLLKRFTASILSNEPSKRSMKSKRQRANSHPNFIIETLMNSGL